MSSLRSLLGAVLPMATFALLSRATKRRVAGATRDEAIETARHLATIGAGAIVSFLGEASPDVASARAHADELSKLLDALEHGHLEAEVALKLTALGLLHDEALCEDLLYGVVHQAWACDRTVRIDMEDARFTDRTLALVRRLRAEGLPVATVLQASLRRTLADARDLAELGVPVSLVAGAYDEAQRIAWKTPCEIAVAYREIFQELLSGGSARVGIATHDPQLCRWAEQLVSHLGLPRTRYEFQMLLGGPEPLRDALLAAGHPVRVYVPYGTDSAAYLGRGAAHIR